MSTFDPVKIALELKWLQDNPAFNERPATINEFLGDGYLELGKGVRDGIRQALINIFGDDVQSHNIANVQEAMVTGAIGIGKTTFASIALPYMVHWVLCLKDPQGFFDLLPGSRIAFMQMSTSEQQARDVIFGDIFARIQHSPWFRANAPHDPKFTKQIRFPGKDIWILPGDSMETTFEGYNILGGILDEMDSHKITKEKDYADDGYRTIRNRITSRFGDRGLIILIGQMKKSTGFAQRKYKSYLAQPGRCYVCRMTLWESFGWSDPRYLKADGSRDSFFYDIKRRAIVPAGVAELLGPDFSDQLMEIPTYYLNEFQNNPEEALKDLAGIPPSVSDPFISLVDKIEICRDKWAERHGDKSPVGINPTRIEFAPWFMNNNDSRRRVLHLDMAYSAEGDALGMAMGHIEEMIMKDNELKPYIVIDFVARLRAAPGTEIFFSDVRRYIYSLKDDHNFKLKEVTMDGFQSQDTKQQLRKRRFTVNDLSVDKSTAPYEDLREAIYDERLEFPKYMTHLKKGDTETVEILLKELMELSDDGKKIDHPASGSKDVADAVAGVVYTLMGDRSYRRGVPNRDRVDDPVDNGARQQLPEDSAGRIDMSQLLQPGTGLKAPLPPTGLTSSGLDIPEHLRR